jgi:hypothetical protein
MDKIFYNQGSAAKLDWDPSWFSCEEFDEDLVDAISDWQNKNDLKADGLCGPTTYRRIYTERQSNIDDYKPNLNSSFYKDEEKTESFIVHRGNFHSINWPKVVLWSESGGLKLEKGFTPYFEERKINMFVNHWDVCLSSESCANVLAKRGISVHFCIDNDGTIYQLIDTNHAGWHAGGRKWNHSSVGVEISNAYYPKYQDWYKRNGFGERPMIEGESCHGNKMKPFMGFYQVQIDALKALWEACHNTMGIPYKCPLDKQGNTLKKVSSPVAANRFKGFVSHYHLTNRKIDCSGMDIKKLLEEIK